MNNNKKILFKLLKRFIKEKGEYNQFKKWIKQTPQGKKELDNFIEFDYSIIYIYCHYSNSNKYINDFLLYITENIIGIDKSLKLFENFISKNYGTNTYEEYIKNIDESFINNQTISVTTIKNQTGIKKLPLNAYLFYAFEWESTQQRHEFWENINDKWRNEFDNIVITEYLSK